MDRLGWGRVSAPGKGSTTVFRLLDEESGLLSADLGLWLHTSHFSSVVSVFKVDARKPREGKWLSLVTQRLGGTTEPRYPEPLVQNSLSTTHLALTSEGPLVLGGGARFSWPQPRSPCRPLWLPSSSFLLSLCFQHFLASGCSFC